MSEPTLLHIAYPPSSNSIWRNIEGRTVLSEAYRKWRKQASWDIASQRPAKVLGPYRLTIVATRPDQRARDLDNLAKPISDALKAAGVIRDDADAVSIWMRWSDGKPDRNGGVTITLEAA